MFERITSILMVFILLFSSFAIADGVSTTDRVVSIGKNLTDSQKNQILSYFGVDKDIEIVEVTNEEERQYLGKYIDAKLLGTRALSCAYVEKLKEGEGITVETHNITWVTEDMYKNALITAGIKDAKVIVASPVKVSGTAALTGIMKAFEDITGESLTKKEKEVASEEIAKTAMLGNEIGQEKASELIENIKINVVANNIRSKKDIRRAVQAAAKELGVELTDEQTDEVVALMKRIAKLNLDLNDIRTQLKDISGKIDKISKQNEEIKSLLNRIIDYFGQLFSKLFG
ncbi:MAG: DUF1002 domain-containing protein [Sporanaerobacter sp.]|jgi:uncharacterized protein YpuA (DUF1002 family)|uniref:DUF1002 domain-containing protein n=1 Tax=Sporanaerobacter sp. TaxID=2010183 RepID=UPI003A0FFE7C